MSTFLIRSATSQSSSYPIVLTRLGGSADLMIISNCGSTGKRTRDLMVNSQTRWPLNQRGIIYIYIYIYIYWPKTDSKSKNKNCIILPSNLVNDIRCKKIDLLSISSEDTWKFLNRSYLFRHSILNFTRKSMKIFFPIIEFLNIKIHFWLLLSESHAL